MTQYYSTSLFETKTLHLLLFINTYGGYSLDIGK